MKKKFKGSISLVGQHPRSKSRSKSASGNRTWLNSLFNSRVGSGPWYWSRYGSRSWSTSSYWSVSRCWSE